MVKIGTIEQIKNYFASDRVSQSGLKQLDKGLSNYLSYTKSDDKSKYYYEEKDYFIIGSAVDCILTGNVGDFSKQYHTIRADKPSGVVMSMLHELSDFSDHGPPTDLEDYSEELKDLSVSHDYYKGKPGPVRIQTIIDNFSEYFKELFFSKGKQILDKETQNKIYEIASSLTGNPSTAPYFDKSPSKGGNKYAFFYQQPIYFEHKGLECKALPDIFILEFNAEKVCIGFHVVDLKTIGRDVYYFPYQMIKMGYHIQAAWYQVAVKEFIKQNYNYSVDLIIKDSEFIVQSTQFINKPLIFSITPETIEYAFNGVPEISNKGIVVRNSKRGIDDLIKLYKYYQDTAWSEDIRSRDMEVIPLNINGYINKNIDG